MKSKLFNSQGVELGPNGFVLCRACKREARGISVETSKDYAYHVRCNPTVFGYADPKEKYKQPTQEVINEAIRVT